MAIDTPEKPAVASYGKPDDYKVIGSRPVRPDGVDKVTGRAIYGADIRLNGMLRGKILRSPHAHARIKSIDTSKAEALPGVKAVITGRDWPVLADKFEDTGEDVVNLSDLGHNLLAVDKVLYKGHAVAAVAAIDPEVAQKALSLIEVDYEVLPAVHDVRSSMKPDAPLLSNRRFTDEMGQKASKPSNIGRHARFESGSLEEGFAQADVVIEREYRTQMVHQGYIEPHASTALWAVDGNITVWTSTQGAFGARDALTDLLKQPISKIKVVPLEIGGGFGAKLGMYLEPLAALLSRKCGKPVQLVMSRVEVFEATGPAPSTSIKIKAGATKDGKIVAWEADLAYEDGAFSGLGAGNACLCMAGPYILPNALLDGYDAVTNHPKTAAYRAPNATQAAFAAETMIDELADKIGMDPLEMRRINGAHEGTRQISGQVFKRIGFLETLETAAKSQHYNSSLGTPAPGKRRGRGVASGFWHNGGMKSAAYAQVNPDGSVSMVEGSVDIGGTRASLPMQLAETLGLPFSKMRVTVADTDGVGYNSNTGGSRTTFASGWAAYEVGMDIRRQLIDKAAVILEVSADDLEYVDGEVRSKDGSKKLTFAELAAKISAGGNLVVGRASVSPTTQGPAFATHIVDVEVDEATGKTDVLRYTCIQDVGTAIHPSYVEGQIQGGAAQGIGWALNEEYVWDNGVMRNTSYLDYRMPTSLDLPNIEAVLVEVPNPGHPYGVRGVGEVPLVPPLAAVGNAVSHALDTRFTSLPLSPRNILAHLGTIAN